MKSLIDLLVARHVALTSTLTVFETFTPGRPKAPERARDMLIPNCARNTKTSGPTRRRARMKPYAVIFPKLMRLEKMFVDAGGTLLAGTDPTGYGGVIPGLLRQARGRVAGRGRVQLSAGAEDRDAERRAVSRPRRRCGLAATGKRADIAVVEGDPMKNPTALENMPLVFKAGIGYRSDAIFDALKGQVGYN